MVEWDNNPLVFYFIEKNEFENKNENLLNFWLDIMSVKSSS